MNKSILYVQNDQQQIADQFINNDYALRNASKIAFVKIQSLKTAISSPQLGAAYRIAVKGMIINSFFQFVPAMNIAMETTLNPSIYN